MRSGWLWSVSAGHREGRLGSKAEVQPRHGNVCCWGKSGHISPKSGHSRRATATRCGAFGGRKTRSRRPPPCTARGPSLVWWCLWTRPAPDGAKGAPARIGLPHPSNEAPRLRRDRWATTATPTTQPTPVVAEAFVLPRQDCPRLNKEQGLALATPHARNDRPEQPITR